MPFAVEVESPVSAARMFKAALFDWHNLGPKIAPHVLSSAALIEGDGSVGSIRQLNFTSDLPFSYVKERLDYIDHEKFECKVTAIEGGHLETILESATVRFKIEPTSTGGCICKAVTESKFKPGAHAGDEEAKAKEALVKLFKGTEAYLLANPDAYV
uniref:Pathogenesis-related protein 10 n=1 Tax=Lilium regale TaxID=82328 RepID=W5RW67_LILRE|nr:pathogenesis-related protein 10 [Lilium regale]